ncbi:MAG: hypothetical protein ABJE47_16840 [bacterium]
MWRLSVPVLFAALVSLAGSRGVAAQQVAYAASVTPELDSATQAAVAREYAHARERGIPVEPLVAKVREGQLKSARGPQIRLAVTKLAARLDSARTALGASSAPEELVAGADALKEGAGSASLRDLRALSPARSLAAPLGTLAQLVASGVQPHKAVEMIAELLRRNASSTQLATLGNLVEGDVSSGLRPDESASIRMRGIEGSLGSLSGDKVTTATVAAPPLFTHPSNPKPAVPVRKP